MELNKITLVINTNYIEKFFNDIDKSNLEIVSIRDLLKLLSIEELNLGENSYSYEQYCSHLNLTVYLNIRYYLEKFRNKIVVIELPETGLSELFQTYVVEDIIDYANNENMKIVVFTYSSVILNEFLVAIKEKYISHTDINVYFENDIGNIISISINEQGRIKYPPVGFFDIISKQRKYLMGF